MPAKYKRVRDTDELLCFMQLAGCAIDAGNFFGDHAVIETKGLAFKGLLDGLEANGITTFAYFDYSTPGWLKKAGLIGAYDYAMRRMDVTEYGKRAVIAPNGISGDDILLGWADRNGNHVLSRDSFDEFDMRYDWVFRGGGGISQAPQVRDQRRVRRDQGREPLDADSQVVLTVSRPPKQRTEGQNPPSIFFSTRPVFR